MKMKLNFFLCIASLLIISLMGCEKKFLDKTPENSFVEDNVFNDFGLVKLLEADIYRGLTGWSGTLSGFDMLATYCDDAMSGDLHTGSFRSGSLDASEPQVVPMWGVKYSYIRKANSFLSKIDDLDVGTQAERDAMKGEVKYLRAALYFDLIKLWGGVPLITNVLTLGEDISNLKRANYEDIVDWIVNELEEASQLVPAERPADEYGRITKGICYATEAQVLLHANSPLHKIGTSLHKGPLFTYSKDTWEDCVKAVRKVFGLHLYHLTEVQSAEDYHNLFLKRSPEIIFPLVNSIDHPYGDGPNRGNGPSEFGGSNETMALQGLIDEFQMKNGKYFNESGSGYDQSPDKFLDNREIRYYADIADVNSTFQGHSWGFAFPDGFIVNSNRVSSGYCDFKYIDESLGAITDPSPLYARIRMADMYLIMAEAFYKLGEEDSTRFYINKVRERALLPDINSSGNRLFKDLVHERRVELCFENRRFYDVRRWMIADSTENAPDVGIIYEKKNQNGDLDPNGNLTYRYHIIRPRVFHEKFYYMPIPQQELDRSGIEPNPGY